MPSHPLRLFLVRHGQSAANLDKSMNVRLPDYSIQLSPEGHEQALAAGHALLQHLSAPASYGPIRILCRPYERTRQISAAIEALLKRWGLRYHKREAVELRELEFGLFDGVPDEDMPREEGMVGPTK